MLRDNRLNAKIAKRHFFQKSVEFLGNILTLLPVVQGRLTRLLRWEFFNNSGFTVASLNPLFHLDPDFLPIFLYLFSIHEFSHGPCASRIASTQASGKTFKGLPFFFFFFMHIISSYLLSVRGNETTTRSFLVTKTL